MDNDIKELIHNINNKLAVISGEVEIITDRLNSQNPIARLRIITESTMECADLVNELSDLLKVKENTSPVLLSK